MLAFLKSLEFLEILRLLKLENFITIVRRNLGSATPPSVMALLESTLTGTGTIMLVAGLTDVIGGTYK